MPLTRGTAPHTLVILGSSNAAGMGASSYHNDPTEDGGWASPPTSWVGLLAASIKETKMLNLSVSGEGSNWAINRLEYIQHELSPDVIMFCTNPTADNDFGKTYLRNATTFVSFCANRRIRPVVRGAYAHNGYSRTHYSRMIELNSNLHKICPHIVDHMSVLSDEVGHFVDGDKYHVDGLHPNDAGHQVLFEATLRSCALYD